MTRLGKKSSLLDVLDGCSPCLIADANPLESSSELRDVDFRPSSIVHAAVTIIHPQLRDLILPLARGHIVYPHVQTLEEMRWDPPEQLSPGSNEDGYDVPTPSPWERSYGEAMSGFYGGRPPRRSETPRKPQPSTRTLFKLDFTPTCLTTNGAFLACGGQKGELFMSDLPPGVEQTEAMHAEPIKPFVLKQNLTSRSINNAITILPTFPNGWARKQADCKQQYVGYSRNSEEPDDDDAESDIDSAESDSDEMDVDDDVSPNVATYPNTLPFGHTPRMSHGRRSSQSSHHHVPQVVTSREGSVASGRSARRRLQEPRILVSSNDTSVKMFSLRHAEDLDREPLYENTPVTSALRQTVDGHDRLDARPYGRLIDAVRWGTNAHGSVPPARTLFGGPTFGYDSIGLNEGILSQNLGMPPRPASASAARERERQRELRERERAQAQQHLPRGEEELHLRPARYHGESWRRYSSRRPDLNEHYAPQPRTRHPNPGPQRIDENLDARRLEDHEPRRLSRIGGQKFRVAVNHSSLSPDLRTMVTVGDSTDVYLYEVIDGGREFRKIGVYNGATDSESGWGFSTAWSKDGRKFAVASQDGQVTVWDHRTSRPLATFFSQRSDPHETPTPLVQLGDQVSSSTGREAARVVKFSPEGSARDLLVFSEDTSNIHIVDARSFQTHVVVPVPWYMDETSRPREHARRGGVEQGTFGISGVAFDPSGDWLYAGTEQTVVEWDLRRYGGGEGGSWSMA